MQTTSIHLPSIYIEPHIPFTPVHSTNPAFLTPGPPTLRLQSSTWYARVPSSPVISLPHVQSFVAALPFYHMPALTPPTQFINRFKSNKIYPGSGTAAILPASLKGLARSLQSWLSGFVLLRDDSPLSTTNPPPSPANETPLLRNQERTIV